MSKLNINGTEYDYDMERVTVRDAMLIKTACGLDLKPFLDSLEKLDPASLQVLALLAKSKAGEKRPDGEPLTLDDVEDFEIISFFVPDPEDPTQPGGEASSEA